MPTRSSVAPARQTVEGSTTSSRQARGPDGPQLHVTNVEADEAALRLIALEQQT
jgi:hypothetical protein